MSSEWSTPFSVSDTSLLLLSSGMLATLLLATADVGCNKVRLEANAGKLEEGTQDFFAIVLCI